MPFGIQFASIQEVLRAVFRVREERQSTLLARLRNMSREGFPPGGPVGRGTRITYTLEQLTAIVFYHLMIDGLLPPDPATRLYVSGRSAILRVVLDTCLAYPPPHKHPGGGTDDLWLRIHPAGLWQLSTASGDVSMGFAEANTLEACEALTLSTTLLRRPGERFVWALDLGGVMWQTFTWLIENGRTSTEDVQQSLMALRHTR